MTGRSLSAPLAFAGASLLAPAALLLGRLLIAYLFIPEGLGKIGAYSAVQAYMADNGVPPWLLPLVILAELGGGAAIVAGLATRLAALALAVFCVLAALLFHRGGDFDAVLQLEKDLAIAGGLLALAVAGGGAWSVDALIGQFAAKGSGRT